MVKRWTVYLSGEIHTHWRQQIIDAVKKEGLPVDFSGPVTVHEDSDDCGAVIVGEPGNAFWRDQLGAGINAIRTKTLIEAADIVVVRFAEKYRQWNAAFDAGMAAAFGKPLVTMHDEALNHALKEVDGAALVTVKTPGQIVDILHYVIDGKLNR